MPANASENPSVAPLENRGHLLTEQSNANSDRLDCLSPLEIVELFAREDAKTVEAIEAAKVPLSRAIETAAQALKSGGRLLYIGAGTSGRLGVLDAAECPPTFCSDPERVQGILAGGEGALVRSSEGLEDRAEDGEAAMDDRQVSERDFAIGITAGGTTPYVRGAIARAKARGAATALIACVTPEQAPWEVDIDIRLLVGPEILAGSTRLKAGTATKMALNIISTGAMVGLGKTYGNRMVDVSVTNRKLRDRALRILQDLAAIDRDDAARLLEASDNWVKLALLMHWTGLDAETGKDLLARHNGQLRAAAAAARSPEG